MGKFFGTDGIRGVANKKLTSELALSVGRACAIVFGKGSKVFIGRDTRISGSMLEQAFVSGATSMGMNVIVGGVLPTPAVALMTRTLKCDIGVVISASHNGINDNGIKIFSSEGFKLSDELEAKIEELMEQKFDDLPIGTGIGTVQYDFEAGDIYIKHILDSVKTDLSGLKIAIDCACGASYALAGKLFKKAGADVVVINNECDGSRINVSCGSTNLSKVSDLTVKENCNFGVAYDGDADRVLFVDENGTPVDGDQIMGMIALDLKSRNELNNNILVSTVMSNMGFELAMKEKDVEFLRTAVGDRYVSLEMRKRNASIGGEQSGHIILSKYNTTGDGMLTSAVVASILKRACKKLSEMSKIFTSIPQILINVKVEDKEAWKKSKEVTDLIDHYSKQLEGRGRILIRPSGTEQLVRVMVEGNKDEETKEIAGKIASKIEAL